MPFGLTNAPSSFQRYINHVLRGYLDAFATAYLDDILVYSETLEEHQDYIKKILQRLKEAGLYLRLDKCEFHKKSVEYLGLIVSEGKVSMNPRKLEAIRKWEEPKNVTEVQEFLGFANFYSTMEI